MPTNAAFTETFAALRAILKRNAGRLTVTTDTPGEFMLASRDQVDRAGKPLFVAGVQIRRAYVSYHLMPVYADPALLKDVSSALRKRMQGKSCFNFTSLDATLERELAALTRKGIARFRTVELPWAPAGSGKKPPKESRG